MLVYTAGSSLSTLVMLFGAFKIPTLDVLPVLSLFYAAVTKCLLTYHLIMKVSLPS